MFSDVRRHTNRKVSTCNFQAEYYACYKILCHGVSWYKYNRYEAMGIWQSCVISQLTD